MGNALVARNPGCQLRMTAGGAGSGPVGQITRGQVRAGEGMGTAAFELRGDQMVDSQGRGCWWTPPTNLLQCGPGQKPDHGFKVGCDGSVSFRGQTTFYGCKTGEQSQYNVYLRPEGVNCAKATLTADSFQAHCQSSPPKPATTMPRSCSANLDGAYEYSHLIVPVDKAQPGKAVGTSYFGEVSASVSSIFNFDITSVDKGKTCSLVFMLPQQKELQTSSYTLSGDGKLGFAMLQSAASMGTTYSNKPGMKQTMPTMTMTPGNNYVIGSFDCPAGKQVTVEVSAVGTAKLRYFQNYNPSPIGLYITKC